jgi:hypothetical protein
MDQLTTASMLTPRREIREQGFTVIRDFMTRHAAGGAGLARRAPIAAATPSGGSAPWIYTPWRGPRCSRTDRGAAHPAILTGSCSPGTC